jgi:nucleotide-binding universal stress UspA family protein
MYKRILVATDGSELALRAVEAAAGLAKALGADLTIVTVTERWPLVEAAAEAEFGSKDAAERYHQIAQRQGEQNLAAAEQVVAAQSASCDTVHVQDSDPASGFMDAARAANADLIVIASHGRRGLTKFLLGSVANEVTATSKVPVLVVR